MTNWEYLQSCDCEQAAHFLCDMVEEEFYKTHDDTEFHCDYCPMTSRCHQGGNGWLIWLKERRNEWLD